ncbi:MAG: DoxX family protein [Clostridia bacterium]|nr:DoxX family protein [Clostridia bacterium]
MDFIQELLGYGAFFLDISLLILRILLAWVFFLHGWNSSFGKKGFKGTIERYKEHGIPMANIMAPFVAISQLVSVPCLALGLFIPFISVLLFAEMVVGTYCKYKEKGWFLGADFPLSLTGIFLVLIFLGGGSYSLDALLGITLFKI